MPEPRRYALAFCDDRPLAPEERRILQREALPIEALGLPIRGLALLGDSACRPCTLSVDGKEIDVWSKIAGPAWYSEGAGTWICAPEAPPVVLDASSRVSLEISNDYGSAEGLFRGAVLLGDWSRSPGALAKGLPCRDIRYVGPCDVPSDGGACPYCNYPRAYAHPDSLLDALRLEEVYVQGTAVTIYPDPGAMPGVVQVVQQDGSASQHAIPPATAALEPTALDKLLTRASHAQFNRDTSALAALGPPVVSELLEFAWVLMHQHVWSPPHPGEVRPARQADLSWAKALVTCLGNLIDADASIGGGDRDLLRIEAAKWSPRRQRDVFALLRELDRLDRIRSVERVPRSFLLVDARLLPEDCLYFPVGPFTRPVSRLRVALLPEESAHVRIYDLRVCTRENEPIGTSVFSRIPGCSPSSVREDGPAIDLGTRVTRQYLPGTVLAGRLREGAAWDPSRPHASRAGDLLGGVVIELPVCLPPLSCAYLFYSVDPGHALVATVEPV